MIEAQLKTAFIGDSYFHSQLAEITKSKFSIVPEVQFINGITADFAMYNNEGQIISIIECKGDDIGVTEYVRGIGQITQYEYLKNFNIAKVPAPRIVNCKGDKRESVLETLITNY